MVMSVVLGTKRELDGAAGVERKRMGCEEKKKGEEEEIGGGGEPRPFGFTGPRRC